MLTKVIDSNVGYLSNVMKILQFIIRNGALKDLQNLHKKRIKNKSKI